MNNKKKNVWLKVATITASVAIAVVCTYLGRPRIPIIKCLPL